MVLLFVAEESVEFVNEQAYYLAGIVGGSVQLELAYPPAVPGFVTVGIGKYADAPGQQVFTPQRKGCAGTKRGNGCFEHMGLVGVFPKGTRTQDAFCRLMLRRQANTGRAV